MLCRAQLCHSMSSVRISLSVIRNVQVPWSHNTSKTISWRNSLRFMLGLTPTWAIWSNGNTPKIRAQKPAISPTCCKIGPRLLWRSTRKSYLHFQLVPKSITLNGQNALLQKKLLYGTRQKNLNEDRPKLWATKCRSTILVSRNISPRLWYFVYWQDFDMYSASCGPPCNSTASCT